MSLVSLISAGFTYAGTRMRGIAAINSRENGHPVPTVYSTFREVADNSSAGPTVFDSGQTVVKVESSGTHWITSGGYLTIPTPSGAAACYYSTGDLGVAVKTVGGRFTFSNTDPDGAAAIAVTNSIIAPTGSMPSMPLHFLSTPYTWTVGVWAGADHGNTGQAVLDNGTYDFATGMVPGAEYEMEAWIVGNTVTVRLPDGSIKGPYADTRIGTYAGNYTFCETYVSASGDSVAKWSHFWADTKTAVVGGPGYAAVSGSVFPGTTIMRDLIVKGDNNPHAGDLAVAEDGTGDGTGGRVQWQNPSTAVPNATVIGKVLTGFSSGAGTVAATDTLLQAFQKIDGNIAAKQPLDSDLTTIAGLTATTDNFMVAASSAWASRTPSQAKTSLSLVKGDVGLGSVDNTADTAKPVSTTQQTALDLKAPLASPALTGTPTAPTASAATNTTQIATTAHVFAERTNTATYTNKTITPRIVTTNAPGATPSINTDTTDIAVFTGLAAAITSMTTNLTGTPATGQRLWIWFKDNATARAITFGASYGASGTASLLATTIISKNHITAYMYDGSKWICVACDVSGY